jgi:hypothetical protein
MHAASLLLVLLPVDAELNPGDHLTVATALAGSHSIFLNLRAMFALS